MDRSSIINPREFFNPPVTIYDIPRTMKAVPLKKAPTKVNIKGNQKEEKKSEQHKLISENNVMKVNSELTTNNSVISSTNQMNNGQKVAPKRNISYQNVVQQNNNPLTTPSNIIPYRNPLEHCVNNNFLQKKNVSYQNVLPPCFNNFANRPFINYDPRNYCQPSIYSSIPANLPFVLPLQPNIQVHNSFPSNAPFNPDVYSPMMSPMHMNSFDNFVADLGHFKILNVQ